MSSFCPAKVAGLRQVFILSLYVMPACARRCSRPWGFSRDKTGMSSALMAPVLRLRDGRDTCSAALVCARLCPRPHVMSEALLGVQVSLP